MCCYFKKKVFDWKGYVKYSWKLIVWDVNFRIFSYFLALDLHAKLKNARSSDGTTDSIGDIMLNWVCVCGIVSWLCLLHISAIRRVQNTEQRCFQSGEKHSPNFIWRNSVVMCFCSRQSPIWIFTTLKKTRFFFPHQSDLSLRPIASWSPAFSRASGGFVSFHFEISLAPRDIFFCSDWLLWLLCFCFYDTFTTEKIFKYKQTF